MKSRIDTLFVQGPTLHDHATGEYIRRATKTDARASREATQQDGGAGVITVDGRRYYVEDGE